MVEEEPDIIRYHDPLSQIPLSKSIRKKISRESVDLKDMTLVEEEQS